MSSEETGPGRDVADPEDPEIRRPGRLARIAFRSFGAFCLLFAVAALVLEGWDIHDVWAASPAKDATAIASILVGVFGAWLLRFPQRPRNAVTYPVLTLAGIVSVSLVIRAASSRAIEPDDAIVRRGGYEDLCPGRTIGEIMAHQDADVQWFSYLNKYGYRSVMVVCDGSRPTPSARMVWSIDENDRFWVQYAERDGTPVDPYGLLDTLCKEMASSTDPTSGG